MLRGAANVIRQKLTVTMPACPWRESPADYAARLKDIARTVNTEHNVENLCHEFPERIRELILREGDRLRK